LLPAFPRQGSLFVNHLSTKGRKSTRYLRLRGGWLVTIQTGPCQHDLRLNQAFKPRECARCAHSIMCSVNTTSLNLGNRGNTVKGCGKWNILTRPSLFALLRSIPTYLYSRISNCNSFSVAIRVEISDLYDKVLRRSTTRSSLVARYFCTLQVVY
jgi:hypothetical protein